MYLNSFCCSDTKDPIGLLTYLDVDRSICYAMSLVVLLKEHEQCWANFNTSSEEYNVYNLAYNESSYFWLANESKFYNTMRNRIML